jgi:hypothetical protein
MLTIQITVTIKRIKRKRKKAPKINLSLFSVNIGLVITKNFFKKQDFSLAFIKNFPPKKFRRG